MSSIKLKKYSKAVLFILVLLPVAFAQNVIVKKSTFCHSLKPDKYILKAKTGYGHWGMAPIYDDKGKLHVFVSATPKDGSWLKDSIIDHYTADRVSGPYTFVSTVFSSPKTTYHNPQISRIDNTYVMVYIRTLAGRGKKKVNLSIGMATANSLYGPWLESLNNPLIKSTRTPNSPRSTHTSNPSFLKDRDGKFRIYYKAISDKKPGFRTICVAVSEKLEGPYIDHPDNPVLTYENLELDMEDPYVFFYKNSYYMIVEDRMGIREKLEGIPKKDERNGGFRPGLIYKSKDGFKWGKPEIGYETNNHYFNERLVRNERPHILWKNGKPECLFITTSRTKKAGYYLKINNW